MNFIDLKEGIPFETTQVEFKERLNHKDSFSYLKTVCAFANTNGGFLFIGVNDTNRELNGRDIHTAEQEVNYLLANCAEHLDPNVGLDFSYLSYTEGKYQKWIVRVKVKESNQKPVLLGYQKRVTAFIRKEGRSIAATADEIRARLISSSSSSFDSFETDDHFDSKDFSVLFNSYRQENNGRELSLARLQSIGFVTENGYLTKGALLFKDSCFDPITTIHLRYWKGLDKSSDTRLDNKEMVGNLITQRKNRIDFILRHSETGIKKTLYSGEKIASYPELAIREAVTNALAHRNYFRHGMEIGVDIFDDRVEILSPGSAYGGKIRKGDKDLLSLYPWRRNQIICNVFSLLHRREKSRSGFEKIRASYHLYSSDRQPVIDCDETVFKITLFDCLYESPRDKIKQNGNQNYQKIIAFCSVPKSAAEIANHLGIQSNSSFRLKYIKPLLDSDLLFRIGKENSPKQKYTSVKPN